MADEEDTEEESEDGIDGEGEGEDGEGAGQKPRGKKKLLLILGLSFLLVSGGIAAAYFTGMLQPVMELVGLGAGAEAEGDGEGAALSAEDAVFYDLPELLVNLNTAGRKSVFLKIRISLELERESDIPRIEMVMPRIIDNFQVYLRELRIDDLKGSAGMYRLREELLTRVAAAASPTRVNDILFKEMLVQ